LEILLLVLLDAFGLLGQFGFASFSPLPLRLVCLLVFQYFTLTLIHNLQEEVLHQAHRFLILLLDLHSNKLIVAGANALELLLQRL